MHYEPLVRRSQFIKHLDDVSSEELDEMIALLPEWRREVVMKYKFEQGRKESAVAYMLLCRGLRECYGITEMPEFEYGEHGKPTLKGHPEIHFNLSHCKKAVVCVLSDHEIGVDVECLGRLYDRNGEVRDALAHYTLCDEEYNRVMSADDPDAEFTKLWTRKEALLKLTGEGITDDIKTVLYKYNNVKIETVLDKDKGYAVSVAKKVP